MKRLGSGGQRAPGASWWKLRARLRADEADGSGAVERLILRTPALLRRRLIAGAALAVLALAAVSGFLAWRQYEDNQHRALNDLNAKVALAGGSVDSIFSGGISALSSIAASPSVVVANTVLMDEYFRRAQKTGAKLFTGGIGWVDASGELRASSSGADPISVSDRLYFERVMATHQPYISAGLIGKRAKQPVVVVAVPTFDEHGKLSGVLTGGISLPKLARPTPAQARRTAQLGFEGGLIIDRNGQQLLDQLAKVKNQELLGRVEKIGTGDLTGQRGFDGRGSDHIIAFATSKVTGWTTVIDRPQSSVYAAARRSLILELGSLAGAVLLVIAILGLLTKRSRRQIDAQQGQARSWSRLSRSLAVAASPAEVADALLDSLTAVFPDGVGVVSVDSEAGQEVRAASILPGWRRVAGDADRLKAVAALTSEEPRTRSLERQQSLRDLYLAFGRRLKALHTLPILGKSGIGGGIALLTERSRLEPAEWELLRAFVDQGTHALERARVHEHEHDLAVRLQRSLLPDRLPAVPGITLAGEYLAGGTGVEVGGDWYDAVRRDDGLLQLCVGDVSGRGVTAATIMGRQRNVFQAYALDYSSPAEILRRMLRHVADDEMITAACVSIDAIAGELVYSCAGHPPPLLLDCASGKVIRLERASSPPLGVTDSEDIVEERMLLPEPARLAMYTDGLVERRGENIEDGIEALAEAIASSSAFTGEQALAAIGERIGAPSDDVALLLAALDPTMSFAIELPADPSVLPGLRRRLRAWLGRRGLDDSQASGVVLAISEACNNAIEHAYHGDGGVVMLSASVDDDALWIEVADRGAWRSEEPSDERGRGMLLMESLMDKVEVETTAAGTRVRLTHRRSVPAPRHAVVVSAQ